MARYTTGELAKLCDVTVRTVQYYDSKGLLKPSDLSDGGRRLYSDEDLTNLRIICPEDHTVFRPPMREMLFAAHKPTARKLTCPTCGYKGYCLEVYALGTEPERVGKTLIWPEGGDAR